MTTTIDIPPELRSQNEAIRATEAAARFLESLDASSDLGAPATATWQLSPHPRHGVGVTVAVEIKDWAFTTSVTCAARDLADQRFRELRLSRFWDHVLQHHLERLVRRTNALIAQAEEEEDARRLAH